MESKKKDLETVLNAGEQTIGAIVCWSLDGYSAPREAFGDALVAAWPDASAALAKQPSPGAALSAAVGKAEKGKGASFMFRAVRNGFAVVRETKADNGERLNHEHVLTVSADESGTSWRDVRAERDNLAEMAELTAKVDASWRAKRSAVDSNELSGVLSELMLGTWKRPLLNAFSVRERTGGVYFVPAETLPNLRAIKAAVEGLSSGCRIGILTISGTNENLANAANDARASFGRHLAELRDEIAKFSADCVAGCKRADSRNLSVRAARFGALTERVDMFRAILGDTADELKAQIESTKTTLLEELEAL